MDLHQIETLLEKYFDGETDLQEETALGEYFTGEANIPEHLKGYKPLFGFFEGEKQKTFDRDLEVPENSPFYSYKWLGAIGGIAAILVLAWLAISLSQPESTPHGNARLAAENTKALFGVLGDAVEESKTNLTYFQELNSLNITENQLILKNENP